MYGKVYTMPYDISYANLYKSPYHNIRHGYKFNI